MGISRRALTLLGFTGITATAGGYWHLRTPKTIIESISPDQVEKLSFSLNSKSYIEYGAEPFSPPDKFVIYDAETLEIMEARVPWLDAHTNILPPGKYNVSTLGYLPDIKAAPVYYLRDRHSDSISLDTFTEDHVDHEEYFGQRVTMEESLYLIQPLLQQFKQVNPNEDRVVINPPDAPISRYGDFTIEQELRVTKRVLDPVFDNTKTKEKYNNMWKEYDKYMAAYKTSGLLNRRLNDSYYSEIIDNITNVRTIDSLDYAINYTSEYVNLSFFAKKASVRNNQATVPVGLSMFLDSDLPSVENETAIYTNTFNVPAVLTPPTSDNSISKFETDMPYKYRQWRIDYEDIGESITKLIQDYADSL